MKAETVKLDLKSVPVMERHPKIFDAWEELEAGSTLQIINDHDPKPLHYQFEGEYQGSYEWKYAEQGPTVKGGVERTIKKYAPEIKSVESI